MNKVSFNTEVNLENADFLMIDGNIVYAKITGNHNRDSARKVFDNFLEFIEGVDGKVNVLADIREVGMVSHGARKLINDAFESEKLGKTAFFGGNPVAKVITAFIMGITKKQDMRYFNSKEEAFEWLRE